MTTLDRLRSRIYSKGLEHLHTHPIRWFKRRGIDREIHNLLLEFFLTSTEGPREPEKATLDVREGQWYFNMDTTPCDKDEALAALVAGRAYLTDRAMMHLASTYGEDKTRELLDDPETGNVVQELISARRRCE